LPSGGKFTHGTSGTITSNGNNMNIVGNGTNSVIQWGGGFNIGKGESVNFGGEDKNYLNIAHGAGKSTIEGILNAGGNNVFLINPNGVIIEKSGSIINAKNFMASTATLSDDDFNTFKNLSFENPQAFSPKIKPNSGNVVNLGKINATNSITLQGNKIVLEAGFDKGSLNKIETDELNLKGNEVYADVGTTKVKKVNVEAGKGTLYLSATGYYYNPAKKYDEFNNVDNKIKKTYNQYISIGSDLDWWHFAKGWNEKADFRNNVVGNTFKLTNDIDFGGNQGKNYANYCIEGLGCTNMIVGYNDAFTKTFDGQGHTLKNIGIDTTVLDNKIYNIGIFGSANGATFKNIKVDYRGGNIKVMDNIWNNSPTNIGAFIGSSSDSTFNNISLTGVNTIDVYAKYGIVGGFIGNASRSSFDKISSDIEKIQTNNINEVGGFVGWANGIKVNNTTISIDEIYASNVGSANIGGFAGYAFNNSFFENILINNIKKISVNSNQKYINELNVGGFVGKNDNGIYKNIKIKGIENIDVKISEKVSSNFNINIGGFAGYLSGYSIFENIAIDNIGNFQATIVKQNNTPSINLGGFVGDIYSNNASFNNIYMNFGENSQFIANSASSSYKRLGKFSGKSDKLASSYLNNIHVYHKNGILTNATSDSQYYGDSNDKIQIHTYNNQSDSEYKDFENKFNSIKDPSLPSITKPAEKEYLSAQEAKEEQATLTKDDLYKDIVNNIFNSLKRHSYAIDLNTLEALLQAYDNLSDTKSKVEFLSNFLLDKSKYQDKEERENLAHSLVQSMDFILAYSKNDAKDSKFESGVVEDTFVKLKAEAVAKHSNALEQGEALKAYVKSLIDPVSSIKNNNEAITNNNTSIKGLQDEYNSLVNSINKGLLDEDELLIAQKMLREIVADIEDLLEENGELQDKNKDLLAQIIIDKGNFRTYGVSSSTPETPTLSAVILNPGTNNGNDNNGDTSNGSDASQVVSSLQKQNSDKLGNAAVVEEEEKNEVDETSLMQKGKICIVSDNSKTMNPCIVGGL
ncbi:filamentous hemagglutinin N-terminal domain-containing protein, partial [Campylobacter lari]|nr:filamentous hemagglutinin N-terminal domain-containing protein [Campylobacter lari]